jgi:thiol:disulfide interchange protein DsbD
MHIRVLICVTILMLTAPSLRAEEATDVVTFTAVADQSAIAPGSSLTIGVLAKLKPGWHIYWLNPGDVGTPTKINWTFPEAATTAGPVLFPIPQKLPQNGDQITYGYEKEVLFVTDITVPRELKPGTNFIASADVSFLVCRDQCQPGRAQLTLTIPVSDRSVSTNMLLFAAWRNRLPTDFNAPRSPVASFYQTPPGKGLERGYIDVRWLGPVSGVDFYPAVSRKVEIGNVVVDHRGAVSRIAYAQKVYDPDVLEGSERGLIVYHDAAGNEQGVWIPLKFRSVMKK